MLTTLEGSRTELAESVQSQRQLVADASHELRTPVASLRTDIEVLRENPELAEDERRRMLTSRRCADRRARRPDHRRDRARPR